jgi:ribosome-binding ATPase
LQEEGANRDWIHICAKLEAEAMIFEEDPVKRREIYQSYGMQDTELTNLINKTFKMLGMINYYTAGVREARAWPIPRGSPARKAAGEIHTDMEKGFIKAETISYDDFVAGSRKFRLEGPNYVVQDGASSAELTKDYPYNLLICYLQEM